VRTNGLQRSIVLLFSPFVKFVEFVAIKIIIGRISVCSLTSGQIGLMLRCIAHGGRRIRVMTALSFGNPGR